MKRIDERDIIFSRMNRRPGTVPYDEYYGRHLDRKNEDDRLRAMQPMDSPECQFFDPMWTPLMTACFRLLGDLSDLTDKKHLQHSKVQKSDHACSQWVLELAFLYGAKRVGMTETSPAFCYSHRGRRDKDYGEPVPIDHPYTIVFAVEMDKNLVAQAPRIQETKAVTKGYIDAAIIGMVLSYAIQELGYDAKNHMDGNYLLILPLAAQAAGLGDIGRNGLLITPEYGPRIRLGAVTTDMPLEKTEKSHFEVKDFCQVCGRCAQFCPAKAIPQGDLEKRPGSFSQERCYATWRKFGTDCGLCMAVCPFSHPLDQDALKEYQKDHSLAKGIVKELEKALMEVQSSRKL